MCVMGFSSPHTSIAKWLTVVFAVVTRLCQQTPSSDTELNDTRHHEERPEEPEVNYEEPNYMAPAENYTSTAESTEPHHVEEEAYQKLGGSDLSYVVAADSHA